MLYKTTYLSPLGTLFLRATETSLTGLDFKEQKGEAQEKELDIFHESKDWLTTYFQGKNPERLPKIALQGTAFQQKVWGILLKIPYGQTTSYGEIAKAIGPRMAAQAVGGAVGHNPIAIIVPCHRVIGKNRTLTGYAGGLNKKKYLLALEGIIL